MLESAQNWSPNGTYILKNAEIKSKIKNQINYKLIRKDRNRQGGGVAIYIHESLSYRQISNPTVDKIIRGYTIIN